jgi:hypothetical protein
MRSAITDTGSLAFFFSECSAALARLMEFPANLAEDFRRPHVALFKPFKKFPTIESVKLCGIAEKPMKPT